MVYSCLSFVFVFAISDLAPTRSLLRCRLVASRLKCVCCLVDRRAVTCGSSSLSPTSWRVETHEILPSIRVDDVRPRPSRPSRARQEAAYRRPVGLTCGQNRPFSCQARNTVTCRNSPLNGRQFESALLRSAKLWHAESKVTVRSSSCVEYCSCQFFRFRSF